MGDFDAFMNRRIYVALGSNLGERERHLQEALTALAESIGTLEKVSSFYETEPVDMVSEHLFLNAVASFSTELTPEALLRETQAVERLLGRTEKSCAGLHPDRIIDIDLLMMEGVSLSTPQLTLPHPEMARRDFVLRPLCEIAPTAVVPLSTARTVRQLLAALEGTEVVECRTFTPGLFARIDLLLRQLTEEAAFTEERLHSLLENPQTHLFVVRTREEEVAAAATLCLCSSPTGTKAWVEDVVTDVRFRGRGLARLLLDEMKLRGAEWGAKCLMLTSRPARTAANRLYRSEGFRPRETNVYTFPFSAGC